MIRAVQDACAQRVVAFVQSYISFSSDKFPLLADFGVELLTALLPMSNAKNKSVRFRVCQLLACVIVALGDDIELRSVSSLRAESDPDRACDSRTGCISQRRAF